MRHNNERSLGFWVFFVVRRGRSGAEARRYGGRNFRRRRLRGEAKMPGRSGILCWRREAHPNVKKNFHNEKLIARLENLKVNARPGIPTGTFGARRFGQVHEKRQARTAFAFYISWRIFSEGPVHLPGLSPSDLSRLVVTVSWRVSAPNWISNGSESCSFNPGFRALFSSRFLLVNQITFEAAASITVQIQFRHVK